MSASATQGCHKKKLGLCGPMPNVMAAQSNICGALCESSVIPFLVLRRKVWLTPTGPVPYSNAANIGERKICTQSEVCTWQTSVRGQNPRKRTVPAQETATQHAKFGWPPVNDVAAVTKSRRETPWNLLACPKRANWSQPLVSRSSPYCEDIWRRLLFKNFYSDRRYMPSLRRYSPTNLCDGAQAANFWRFFASCISASHMQHISDMHSKFALRLHHVSKYDRHPISDRWE